jgi:formate-dependent nitrite reductase membrane component NrfD
MFKSWVPMSVGAWSVLAFSFFALLSFVAAFAGHRHPDWHLARRLRPPGIVGTLVCMLGALFALVVTGYTGVMISVLNRPVWSDTPLFGMLFLVSAVTMGAALLALGAAWLRWRSPALAALQRIWVWLLVLQILVWIALFVSLGPAVRGWLNVWGIVLAIGIAIGIVLPLLAGRRRDALGLRAARRAAGPAATPATARWSCACTKGRARTTTRHAWCPPRCRRWTPPARRVNLAAAEPGIYAR